MSNRMAPRPFASSSGEQPITASVASVSRSITSSRDAGLRQRPDRGSVGIGGGAAGLGRDQPQALGLAVADLVAAEC